MAITRAETTPTILTSSDNTTMTFATRAAMAASAANMMSEDSGISAQADTSGAASGSNLRTPDYHLPFTGPEVEDALWKIINLKIEGVGGITIIESSVDAPYNLDLLVNPGNYVLDYAQSNTFPDSLKGVTVLNVSVYRNAQGHLIQIMEAAGQKWYRFSQNGGLTWSAWAVKTTNGPDDIDTTRDPAQPAPKDPITVLEENQAELEKKIGDVNTAIGNINTRITNLETSISNLSGSMLKLGPADTATKILNGTFDYDTVVTV